MASESDNTRPHAPSARRLQRAWREGQIPLSRLVTAVAALTAGFAVASWGAKSALDLTLALFRMALANMFETERFPAHAAKLGDKTFALGLALWTPVAVGAFAVALLVGLAQTRGALRRLVGPASRAKSGGAAGWAPLALGGACFALVSATLLWSARGSLIHVSHSPQATSLLSAFGKLTLWLLLRLLLVAATWAALDCVWQWWRWRLGLQMSQRELREENRAHEGDAQLRAARQRLARELGQADRTP